MGFLRLTGRNTPIIFPIDMTFSEQFRSEVEDFIAKSGMDPTAFGLAVMNDGSFVFDLRRGRSCRVDTIDKVRAFIAQHRERAA